LEKSYKGSAQKVISKTTLQNIKIPIPPLKLQDKIVEVFNVLIENTHKINTEKINNLKQNNKMCLEMLKLSREFEEKALGEVCEIIIGGTPSTKINKYWYNGTNIWVSIKDLNTDIITNTKKKITDDGVKNSNVKLLKKGTLMFSFKLTIGKVGIAGCDLYTNEAIAGLIPLDTNINNKYLYYYLQNTKFTKATGLIGGGSYNKDSLKTIKIPVPSLEKQQEIITYCENNDRKIKELEKEIIDNKAMAKSFLNSVLTKKINLEDVEPLALENSTEPETFNEEDEEEQVEDINNIDNE
jgi:restriction endonuclease S subunit